MHPFITIAIRAAEAAGQIIARGYDRRDALKIGVKGRHNYVTEIDLAAEKRIVEIISEAYPHHGFITEEQGSLGDSRHEYQWIIDPLDGTTNFIHGLPNFVVSIVCQKKGVSEAAVIYHPLTCDTYVAARGKGAQLNGQRMRVAKRDKFDGALLSLGAVRPEEHMGRYFNCIKALHGKVAGVRRSGATALELAYVAAGKLDGFWHEDSKPWDLAAGALLIREAGGVVTDRLGQENYLKNGSVVATNPKLMTALLTLLR